MKLIPLTNENSRKKIKMIITERQFKALSNKVWLIQEQAPIMKNNIIKNTSNA
jgi:hypothetical protein